MHARQVGKTSCSRRRAKIRRDRPGPGTADALAFYVKTDAMWVGTKSARTSDMVATQGDVTRVRLTLEGERAFAVGEGATFTPCAEVAPGAR